MAPSTTSVAHQYQTTLNMASVKSSLFYSAAAVNLLIIPKHLKVGATNVSSAIQTIPEDSPVVKRGKEVVRTAWDLTNESLFILGMQ